MSHARRALLLLLAVIVVTLALGLAAATWALRSDSGSRQLLQWGFAAVGAAGHELTAGRIEGSLLQGLQLRELQFALADGSVTLEVRQLEFAWDPGRLLQRSLGLRTLYIDGLRWRTRREAAATDPFDAGRITQWFAALPVDVDLAQAQLRDLAFEVGPARLQIPELDFTAALDRQRLVLRELDLLAFDLRVEGGLALQQDLGVQGSLSWSRQPDAAWAGRAQVTGSLRELQLQHELQAPLPVSSSGSVGTGLSPGDTLQLDLRHRLDRVDLSGWGLQDLVLSEVELLTTGAPSALAAELTLQAQYQDFAPLALQAGVTYSPELLRIDSGRLRSDEIDLSLQGAWEPAARRVDLQWDLQRLDLQRDGLHLAEVQGGGSAALLLQDTGTAGRLLFGPLQGQLNSQALSANVELLLQDSAVQSVLLDLASAGNRLQVEGALQPALDLAWTLDAPALEQLHDMLAGQLTGSGTLAGSTDEPVLTGSLQGRQLAYVQSGQRFALQELQLQSSRGSNGGNALHLQLEGLALQRGGTVSRVLDSASVRVNGSAAEHRVDAQLSGMDGALELGFTGGLQDRRWQARILKAAIATPVGEWAADVPVGLAWQDGTLSVDAHCWTGAPPALCLSLGGSTAAGYSLGLDVQDLPLAWLNSGAAAPGKPAILQELQSARGLDLPAGLSVHGSATLTASIDAWRAWPPAALQAELRTRDVELQVTPRLDPGISTTPADIQRYAVDSAPLQVTLASGIWRAVGELDITQRQEPGASDDAAALQGTLGADLTVDAADRLGGVLRLSFGDLAFVESLVPGLQQSTGRLQGVATLAGTLDAPAVDADLTVSEGSFALPALGIAVQDFGAQLRSSNDAMVLRASGVSGAGELVLQARLLRPFAADREFSARLEGSNFTLLDTATASATVSPAVDLLFADNMLELQGRVDLPDATLDLESVIADVAEGGVGVSRDALVIQPDSDALVAEQQRVLPFNARLDLQLGDAVRVRGFGLDVALNGELRLEQEAGRALLAYGELGIPEGTYRIYNQELSARDGRLLFYGNPVNPVLDVRAFRETATAEVGMLLSGTLGRIESRLYSTPTLPDNEILAMLVTGKSFNNMDDEDGNALLSAVANLGIERGEGLTSMIGNKLGLDSVAINGGDSYLQSSLGLGKYITPDLLMRYEIGIFDRQAVLSIDYALSERLKLEVRSGLSQSVDISYTIEKD